MPLNTVISYPVDPMCLEGKVILVTGSGSGVGCAVAIAAARFGATVILMSRTLKKMNAVYDHILSLGYKEPFLYPLDFLHATPETLKTCATQIKEHFGALDGLVHNAAMLGQLSPLEHYPASTWLKVMQVNLNIPVLLTQSLLPLLKKAKRSSILFTTGSIATLAKPYWGAFCASKHALQGVAQLLASELETNTSVRVHTVDPGPIRSALRATAFPAGMSPHILCPEAITNPYLYLLSDTCQATTGKSFTAQKIQDNTMAF